MPVCQVRVCKHACVPACNWVLPIYVLTTPWHQPNHHPSAFSSPPILPCPGTNLTIIHQLADFFTLDDSVAKLVVRDLLLINMCAVIVLPDPRLLPNAVFCTTNNIHSITYSRCAGLHGGGHVPHHVGGACAASCREGVCHIM